MLARKKLLEIFCKIESAGEAGLAVSDVCRKHSCPERSFYRRKAKFGGMDLSEAKRLQELERENAQLKKIGAEQTLDIRMLKDVNSRKC